MLVMSPEHGQSVVSSLQHRETSMRSLGWSNKRLHRYVYNVTCRSHATSDYSPVQLCKPGVTLNYLHSVAVEMMASELKGNALY